MENNNIQILQGKPEITYPCEWEYRIIGENEDKIKEAVFEIMPRPYTLETKNKSSKGRFVSFHAKIITNTEEERNEIYTKLSAHPEIKMVI
ncbi:DUF493 domain-containing protein [Helicobacter sp. 12S02232-10]|uniref:HP0495 family protein n=1 Tax=Helicobacter sp. 12S02232-10 TaxID=1476197 RepID=UPI000BA505A9|nr:DUF493 domain-containing protein [Helicobacter sp. 12S02232-10]PAF47950.1 DUF493 domain-containing protein [Helicobacter sp. 12S02232-10]